MYQHKIMLILRFYNSYDVLMFDKLCDNLNLLMSEARLNAEELSRRIGLPASTIKKIRNRESTNPTLATLIPLAQYFSLSVSQLIGDEPFPQSRMKGVYQANTEALCYFPLLTWEEAILWPKTKIKPREMISTEHRYSKDAYALIVQEENWDNLMKGTCLLIDPSLQSEHRDYVIVYKKGQKSPSLKQVLHDEGNIYLKPVVSGYNLVVFNSEYEILGVVVEYKKHLKKFDGKAKGSFYEE